MKQFRCGEIVPGCEWTLEGDSDEQILGHVAEHAREKHGMDEAPPGSRTRVVRSLIVEE